VTIGCTHLRKKKGAASAKRRRKKKEQQLILLNAAEMTASIDTSALANAKNAVAQLLRGIASSNAFNQFIYKPSIPSSQRRLKQCVTFTQPLASAKTPVAHRDIPPSYMF
jgi:hypothetical protein